jgi:hypothetical protein
MCKKRIRIFLRDNVYLKKLRKMPRFWWDFDNKDKFLPFANITIKIL